MAVKRRSTSTTTTLRRVPSSVFRANLAEILSAVGEGRERIIIERRGRPPVALVSADDFLQFQMLEGQRKKERPGRKRP